MEESEAAAQIKNKKLKWPKGEEGLARKEERACYRVPREHELLHWFLYLPPLGDCHKYIVFEKLLYLYFIPIVLKKNYDVGVPWPNTTNPRVALAKHYTNAHKTNFKRFRKLNIGASLRFMSLYQFLGRYI